MIIPSLPTTYNINQSLSLYPIDHHSSPMFSRGVFSNLQSHSSIPVILGHSDSIPAKSHHLKPFPSHYHLYRSHTPISLHCHRSWATPLRSPSIPLSYPYLTALHQSGSFYFKFSWFFISPLFLSLFHLFYHFPFRFSSQFSFPSLLSACQYINVCATPGIIKKSFITHSSAQKLRQSVCIVLTHFILLSIIFIITDKMALS